MFTLFKASRLAPKPTKSSFKKIEKKYEFSVRRAGHNSTDPHHGHHAKLPMRPELPLVEEPRNYIPNNWEVSVGYERLDEEDSPFFGTTELEGPFGTRENPCVVPSFDGHRFVACLGGPNGNDHEMLWHWIKEGKPTVCLECGQFFQIERVYDEYSPAPGAGGHAHH
eukprot:TRINITY_DN4937_c1_g1_i1.p1 TRINITY_DN4937_c1_g1~~TRINITY_DN4937_c1_g1_i1.p1  ORF type:complete len:167 (+),score=44.24 TRINITY_DN4937_c1_g1_i1:225-725(+)